MLKIRYVDVSDETALIELLQTIFPQKAYPGFNDFWRWEMLRNPFAQGQRPSIIISELDHKIVGVLAGIPSKLLMDGVMTDCIWLIDYGTHPDYRFKAGAFKIAHTYMKEFDVLLGFGNLNSTVIGERVGFSHIRVPMLVNLLSIKKLVQEKIPSPALATVLNLFWKSLNSFYLFSFERGDQTRIEEITGFDERFGDLWERVKSDYPMICCRDRAYLQWRYADVPGYEYKTFAAVNDHGITGFIVLRIEERGAYRIGLIADLLCGADDLGTLKSLIKSGLTYFKQNSVDMIKCFSPPFIHHKLIYKKFGFLFKRRGLNVFFRSRLDHKKEIFLNKRHQWYLTIGDSDIDFCAFIR